MKMIAKDEGEKEIEKKRNCNEAAMNKAERRRRRQSNESKLYRQYVLRIIAIGKAQAPRTRKYTQEPF